MAIIYSVPYITTTDAVTTTNTVVSNWAYTYTPMVRNNEEELYRYIKARIEQEQRDDIDSLHRMYQNKLREQEEYFRALLQLLGPLPKLPISSQSDMELLVTKRKFHWEDGGVPSEPSS